MTKELLEAVVDSAWDNLEATKGTTGDQASREFTIPGWNEKVKPFHSKGNSGTLVGWLKNQPGYQAFINSLPKKFGRLPGGSGQKIYNLMLGP